MQKVPLPNRGILAGRHEDGGVTPAPRTQFQTAGKAEHRLLNPGHPACGNDGRYG